MSALARSYKPSLFLLPISRVLFCSTEASIVKQKQISKNDSLYRRISPAGDPNVSIVPILDQWKNEGKFVSFDEFMFTIKSLRKFNRYTHALQLSKWMSKGKNKLKPVSVAVHLDLVSKVEGVEQAEKYYNSLPDEVKNLRVYGALLNCYATTKSVKKAEALAEKMKQMGMMTRLSYHSMLNLYKRIGEIERVDEVYQEMIELGVPCDKSTYYIRVSAYAAASDLEKMEKVVKDMEANYSSLKVDLNVYIIASSGYLKSGLADKALEMLKKSEECIHGNSKGVPWEIIIGMYASVGKKDDVHRIWNLYKSSTRKVFNKGYCCVIHALVKHDDIDGAEKVLQEWESQDLSFDFRVPNVLIKAYCTKGVMVKAEAYVDRAVAMGKQPRASTWAILATGYTKTKEMEKAVEMVKKCVAAEDNRWCKLDQDTFNACVEYLEEKGDFEMRDEIEKTFKDRIRLPVISG